MQIQLHIRLPSGEGHTWNNAPGVTTIHVGRDPSCELHFHDGCGGTLSRRHAVIYVENESLLIKDLGSSNGTFLNEEPLRNATALNQGDRIALGRSGPQITLLQFIRSARGPTPSAKHATMLHPRLSEPSKSSLRFEQDRLPTPQRKAEIQPHKLVSLPPFASIAGRSEFILVGRADECQLKLDDPRVSRQHARLTRTGYGIILEDLGSSNGTFVGGTRISRPVAVTPDDLIGVGRFTFKLNDVGQLEEQSREGHISIELQRLRVKVRDRTLLDDISLTVNPSEFVALMGPSGAGKTTLMTSVNGYTHPTNGSVLYNGQDLYSSYDQFRGVLGYVPQDDIMHADLTVRQALYYTAKLRLPSDTTEGEIRQRILKVIDQLGLQGTENVLIGSAQKKGISGGQRKRVNLAMELLTDPTVLFLDEPTSGLSSEDALTVMTLIRRLADEGKTVLLTIHQPSLEVYRLLDNLILVGKDHNSPEPGRLVYYGPAFPDAICFFNPEQQHIAESTPSPDDVLKGYKKRSSADWRELYQASPLKRRFVDERANKPHPREKVTATTKVKNSGGFRQWWTLVERSLAIKAKDVANTSLLLAQAPIIAILVVLVFGNQVTKKATTAVEWQSVSQAMATTMFMVALSALWFGCSNSVREIVGEWPVYHRERMVNLKISAYLGSKFMVLGMLCIIQCLTLLGIVYLGVGLKGNVVAMFLLLLLTSWVGLAVGLTISSLSKTSEVAIAILPLVLLPMVILGGVVLPVGKMDKLGRFATKLTPSRWAFEGLLLLESDKRPLRPEVAVPQGMLPMPAKDDSATPKRPDMAEDFFPAESSEKDKDGKTIEKQRTSLTNCAGILATMLLLLLGSICGILRSRDVH